MSIEDVAEKADIWSESIKKIIKAITAAMSKSNPLAASSLKNHLKGAVM